MTMSSNVANIAAYATRLESLTDDQLADERMEQAEGHLDCSPHDYAYEAWFVVMAAMLTHEEEIRKERALRWPV